MRMVAAAAPMVWTAAALIAAAVLACVPACAADRDFSYGAGTGAYAPGASTTYGVGSGAYAPQAQGGTVTPRYGAPGSVNSGFRAPSVPGQVAPGMGMTGTGMTGTAAPGSLLPGSSSAGQAVPGGVGSGRDGTPGLGAAGTGRGGLAPGGGLGVAQGVMPGPMPGAAAGGGAAGFGASPFALAPIDTGISPRRAPRVPPGQVTGPFGMPLAPGADGRPAPDAATSPYDPFRR